ncbi:mesothelin-like protein [Platysternon megacephalum]|uniref:Mesothelin-like protein n=1 Tax=Platysternon megacephalum TaxID=55544 RepID=A0A4D9EK38_9SAUR|nr:mesothelin-like protein [Platysternon megacephalum]
MLDFQRQCSIKKQYFQFTGEGNILLLCYTVFTTIFIGSEIWSMTLNTALLYGHNKWKLSLPLVTRVITHYLTAYCRDLFLNHVQGALNKNSWTLLKQILTTPTKNMVQWSIYKSSASNHPSSYIDR